MTDFHPDSAPGRDEKSRELTARQRQVLALVIRGFANKAIATELGISEQGAKEHVSNLLHRLGAPNRAALAEIGTLRSLLGSTDLDPTWLPRLFLSAPIAIVILRGPDHRVAAANEMAAWLVDGSESHGRPLGHALGHAADRLLPALDAAYRSGQPQSVHELALTTDQAGAPETHVVSLVVQPLVGEDGSVVGQIVFAIDISAAVTARQRVETLTAEQLAVFDLITDGVMVADATGHLVKINAAARRVAGVPDDFTDLLEERIAQFKLRHLDGQPVPRADVPLVRALAGETLPWTDYLAVRPTDGVDIRLRAAATPMRSSSGDVVGGVVVFRRLPGG